MNKHSLRKTIVLVLSLTCLFSSFPAPNAETFVTVVSGVAASPNPVGVNQVIKIVATLNPAPPRGYFYQNLVFHLTLPDGTTESLGPLDSDSAGQVCVYYIPPMTGTYIVSFKSPEQTVNNDLYLESSAFFGNFIVHESSDNPDSEPFPNFSFRYVLPEIEKSVSFDASGIIDPDGEIGNYSWDFGDGTTASGVTTSHSYSSYGSYIVTLVVTDSYGLTSRISRTIDVGTVTELASLPKPLVPDFTLKMDTQPYDVPPEYATDQFTGANLTIHEGYHVENKSIVVTIKNQPFVELINDTRYYLVYNIQIKGRFGDQWETLFSSIYGGIGSLVPMSDSNYTFIKVPADEYPAGAQVDVQVKAIILYDSLVRVYDHLMDTVGHLVSGVDFYDESDWSETKTITLETNSPSEPTNDESSSKNEEHNHLELLGVDFGLVVLVVAVIVITACLLIYFKRKHRH